LISKKHPGHLIPLHPPPNINAAAPLPPAHSAALPLLPHQALPLPLHPPLLPHIPPDFIAAIGAVVGDALHQEAMAQNAAVPARPPPPAPAPAPAPALAVPIPPHTIK
jgi:hypothetical protein